MFEVGEKVVCIFDFKSSNNKPKIQEIVTIESIKECHGNVFLNISEYLFDSDGKEQCFLSTGFRKLDHSFAEELLKELSLYHAEELLTV